MEFWILQELKLIPDMREHKPWVVPAGYKVPVVVRVPNQNLKDKSGATAGMIIHKSHNA